MEWQGNLSVAVADVLDLVRQAYEDCARMVEECGDEKMAHAIRKLIAGIKAEPDGKGKVVFTTPVYIEKKDQ